MNPTAAARPVSARTTPFDGNASTREEDITCPDPSVHEVAAREKALQDQAATAAHHVIHAERDTKIRGTNPLGPDGRLSAACARHECEPHPVKKLTTMHRCRYISKVRSRRRLALFSLRWHRQIRLCTLRRQPSE